MKVLKITHIIRNQESVWPYEPERSVIMEKKLFRSTGNRYLCGVCGGIGEYFHIDPTIVRLAWAIFGLTGAGVLAYIVAAIVIPSEI